MTEQKLVDLAAMPQPVHEPMGEVFTRRWVVEWMLDLLGFTPDRPLYDSKLIEPSCGAGAFLLPAVDRLVASCQENGVPLSETAAAIDAMDLHAPSVETTRAAIVAKLEAHGVRTSDAETLAHSWVRVADFLLEDDLPEADFVVGNPPYVRLEDVPNDLAEEYRQRWTTMRGRADLYVGFYERGLLSLRNAGRLVYICADRWMRNAYGRGLRKLIAYGPYSVDCIVRLHDVNCFDRDVSAYPAITLLRRGEQGNGIVIDSNENFGPLDIPAVKQTLEEGTGEGNFTVGVVEGWFGEDVWPEGTPEELGRVSDYEARHEPLEDALGRTRVGIGIATGADSIFVTNDPNLVESDRLLPLLMSHHIADGSLRWSQTYLVNPWAEDGLVDLDKFPLLKQYLQSYRGHLGQRHTARRAPRHWYKTIDRVNPWLADTPKVLLSDMKSRMTPVVESGGLYPHHNLYWITSLTWDVEVLAGLLLSEQAELFIRAYCVKMRGGTLRMQAQYLRRIRVPVSQTLTDAQRDDLRLAYRESNRKLATRIARRLYDE